MKKQGHISNSCLYSCEVMHARKEKVKRMFRYRIFLFCIDLNEIEFLTKQLFFVSHNRFNYFNFRDRDHLQIENSEAKHSVRSQIEKFLQMNSVRQKPLRIMLLTNLCTLGYQFNPVSFYYCYNETDEPFACVAEINNTFGEMKLFLLTRDHFKNGSFRNTQKKYFYVSPFIDHDVTFDFDLNPPGETLNNRIDDYKNGQRIFTAILSGKRIQLNNLNLFKYMLRFPFITLKVIFLIHFQALKLYLKGLSFYRKEERLDLQRNRLKKFEERKQVI